MIKKTRGRKKKHLTREQKIKWLQENPNLRGRPHKNWTTLLEPIPQATVDGLVLACYQILLICPKGQEHLRPNTRYIDLLLPFDFRKRYGRAFPQGQMIGKTPDKWWVRYRVRVSRLYDYLYERGYIDLPRSGFNSAAQSAKMTLVGIEKEIEILIPPDVREKIENKIVEVIDKKNTVEDN